MTIGASIFIAAVGAILRFAVNDRFDDVDLAVVGNILMVAGAVGLIVGLVLSMQSRRVVTEVRDDPRRR
ncbi:hypothetical protein BH23ACT2_BH23ACT2_11230 [soil metagenome]